MLEPPTDISNDQIMAWLREAYGLTITQVAFLPLGADSSTITYRATGDAQAYFVKLRRGVFDPVTVEFPHWLTTQGVQHIIAPILTTDHRAWVRFDNTTIMLYPFVEGQNGYQQALTPLQWQAFATTLKQLHTAVLPTPLAAAIPRETYDPQWRTTFSTFLQGRTDLVDDPVAQRLRGWLNDNQHTLLRLVERAESLASELQAIPRQFIVCHADIHAGNVLIDRHDHLLIVDWDTLLYAPKERDLMFIGGAQGFIAPSPAHEEGAFYVSYGPTHIDHRAIAYYRYERIIQDLAIYCEELLLTTAGGADREQSLRYALSNLRPNGTLEMADRANQAI